MRRWQLTIGSMVATSFVSAFLLLASSQLFGVKMANAAALINSEPNACPTLYSSEHQRFGFNFDRTPGQLLQHYDYAQLNAGWFHDYGRDASPPDDIHYYQMIRPRINMETITNTVGSVVDANPGAVWFVGNEPDKIDGQDNLTSAEYAEFYHDIYTFLKARDPSAQVALAGIVQATPLRLAYLDRVLSEYQSRYGQPLPVDIMTVHNFILCEVCDWGAGLPPGMDGTEAEGRNYEVDDHIRMDIFKEQIVAMRQWMADNGYRDKPLIVNEYGVLMPVFFEGFGYQEVRDFMLATFDFFLTATDDQIGYPADSGRLVQEFAWFSLNSEPYDEETFLGFNGELFVHDTGAITPWGQDFIQYIAPLVQQTDVAIADVAISPSLVVLPSSNGGGTTGMPAATSVTIQVTVENGGQISAYGTSATLWQGDPASGGTLIETVMVPGSIDPGPAGSAPTITFTWTTDNLEAGATDLTVTLDAASCNPERTTSNQQATASMIVIPEADLRALYLPLVQP